MTGGFWGDDDDANVDFMTIVPPLPPPPPLKQIHWGSPPEKILNFQQLSTYLNRDKKYHIGEKLFGAVVDHFHCSFR